MNEIRRILAAAVCAALLLTGTCALAESEDEETLRLLLSAITGTWNYSHFCYGDYDGDGRGEAFALTADGGSADDGYMGELWYVCREGCMKLRERSSYLFCQAEGRAPMMVFTAEEWFGGSGSTSYVWYVKDSRPKAMDLSSLSGFSHDGGNRFSAYPDDFDMFSDGTGHTYKRYYYYFDPVAEALREYGGLEISQSELLEFEGAESILASAKSQGWEIGEIFYRANGIINVNLWQDGRNENLTLSYDDTSVTDTIESFSYGGSYKWANNPEIAVKPEAFVHPNRGLSLSLDSLMRYPMAGTPMDVFEFDRLSGLYVYGAEATREGDLQHCVVYLREDVNSGGSDGYYEDWVVENGVLADWVLDLDGDGQIELLTLENNHDSITRYGYPYSGSHCDAVVYELVNGAFAEAARVVNLCDLMPMGHSLTRCVAAGNGAYLVNAWMGGGDGGTYTVNLSVMRYDGERLNLDFSSSVTNMGDSYWARDLGEVTDAGWAVWAILDSRWSGEQVDPASLGLREGENFRYWAYDYGQSYDRYEDQFDYSHFGEVSRLLAPYGLSLSLEVSDEGYMQGAVLNGGETMMEVSDYTPIHPLATEILLHSSLNHKPVLFERVPSPEELYEDYGW